MTDGFFIHGMSFTPDRFRRWVAFVQDELQRSERAEFLASLADPDGHSLSDEMIARLKSLTLTFILQEKQGQ